MRNEIEIVKQQSRWFLVGLDMSNATEREIAVASFRTKRAAESAAARTIATRANG